MVLPPPYNPNDLDLWAKAQTEWRREELMGDPLMRGRAPWRAIRQRLIVGFLLVLALIVAFRLLGLLVRVSEAP